MNIYDAKPNNVTINQHRISQRGNDTSVKIYLEANLSQKDQKAQSFVKL